MALFSRVTTWVSNQVLTASALNGEFNNILNNAQLSSWVGFSSDVSQMQQQTDPGAVGSESLAGSGSDELQRIRYMLAFLSGQTYWYNHTGRSLGTGLLAVQTNDIAASAVTTAKIADGNVTQAKRVALGQQLSSSSGAFTMTSNAFAQVTNLSVTITTTGRPVFIGLQDDGSATGSYITTGDSTSRVAFFQGAGQLNEFLIGPSNVYYSPGAFWYIVNPGSAGSYTFTCKVHNADNASTVTVNDVKLLVYEL